MNRIRWSRACLGLAASLVAVLAAGGAQAQSNEDDGLALKLAGAIKRDRLFMRAGVIGVKIKTKSSQTRDVTGPVMTLEELENVFYNNTELGDYGVDIPYTERVDAALTEILSKYPNVNFSVPGVRPIDVLYELFTRNPSGDSLNPQLGALQSYQYGVPLLTQYMIDEKLTGIGTPPGITGVAAKHAGTAGISVGYFLDEDLKWAVETYVLAAPLSTSVSIRGTAQELGRNGQMITRPIAIDGQKIIKTKLLPPTVMLGRYFGNADAKFRPYLGAMAMYAVFFDTKATETLNNYVGGSNPGDTSVSIKNAFGIGPMVGMKYQFNDKWHASLNVGHVKLKTVATLTTRNTFISSGDAILKDLGGISEKITTGEGTYFLPPGCNTLACTVVKQNGGLVTLISKGVAADRAAREGRPVDDKTNLGTYVRKTDTTLTNTVFMLSVGRSF